MQFFGTKMAHIYFIYLIISTIVMGTCQSDKTKDYSNILAEAASEILKEQNVENIGSLLNSFMQSDNAKQLGNLMETIGSGKNGMGLLKGLRNIIAASGDTQKKESNGFSPDILQNLGSMVEMFTNQGQGSEVSKEGRNSDQNNAMISNMINLFANSMLSQQSKKGDGNADSSGLGLNDILTIASMFMDQTPQKQDNPNVLDFAQTLIQTVASLNGPEAQRRAESHSEHSWALPSYLEKIHIFFDNFVNSETGKYILKMLETEKFLKDFYDESGKFDFEKFDEMVQNRSYRKKWIRVLTSRLMNILRPLTNSKLQRRYFTTAIAFLNGYLNTQGFPKNAQYDSKRPTETVSNFVNYAAKKYLDITISSKEYVKPIIEYAQEIISLLQFKGKDTEFKELTDKLVNTIDSDIIDPLTHVSRAYKFVKEVPECDRYVYCILNNKNKTPEVKSLLYKAASLVAAWFSNTSTTYWTFYTDIMEQKNCKALYMQKCGAFHKEETMDENYLHNEL